MKNLEKNFSHTIIMNSEHAIDECCSSFWRSLQNDYLRFKENLKSEDDEYKNLLNDNKIKGNSKIKDNVIFTPEKISIRSPLTILNAPWGTGKSFFIEYLCKMFITGKVKLEHIKKIIVIDAWKYSTSECIPDELVAELFANLTNKMTREAKEKTLLVARFFYNTVARPWINRFAGIELDKVNEPNKDFCKITNDIRGIIKDPTLIVLDNIERIGKNSWEIIKAIQKLTIIDNLIFLLPMNKDKLNNSYGNQCGEWSIEKYITIPLYNFEQDYKGVLRKYNFKENIIEILDSMLNVQIDGEQLTVRELDNILSKKNYLSGFDKNKYEGLFLFSKIWKPNEFLNNCITKDIDLFRKSLSKVCESYEDISNFLLKEWISIFEKMSFLDIFKSEEEINKFNTMKKEWFTEYGFYASFGYDWIAEWNNFIENLLNISKSIKTEKDKTDKELKLIIDLIKKDKEELQREISRVADLQKSISDYNEGLIVHNVDTNKEYAANKTELDTQTKSIEVISGNINNLDHKYQELSKLTETCKELLEGENSIKNKVIIFKEKIDAYTQVLTPLEKDGDFMVLLNSHVNVKDEYTKNGKNFDFFSDATIEMVIKIIIQKYFK